MNLGTWRIVILAALVVSGGLILANGFSGGEVAPAPETGATGGTGEPSPSVTVTPEPPPEGQVEGVTIAVLNGTSEVGLAADVTLALEEAGYTSGQDAADAPTTGVRRTIVYFRPGDDPAQARANAQLLADTELGGAAVRKLAPEFADLVPAATQLVIVLGRDQIPS